MCVCQKIDLGDFGPNVESFFFCLDSEALELVLKDGTIFCDHTSKVNVILHGEYALSKCLIYKGYTIDCMLKKYENINWYDHANYFINNNLHPSRKNSFFGSSIDPYDVIVYKWYWNHEPHKPVLYKSLRNILEKKYKSI